jgi:hypothetical protein
MAKPDVFSVPRRFDLATVLVAMAAFSLLFAGLLLLDAPPSVLAYLGGFLALVAAAQWIASNWNRPRTASVVAGILIYWVAGVAETLLMSPRMGLPQLIAIQLVSATLAGSIAGYLGGVLVGGIFLVSHYLREWLKLGRHACIEESQESESPWEDEEPQS